ncbi:Rep2 [Mosquito VEM virus SDBVL G]|uniref:Replication-associated protein n=1 Tax=Mosquito VEM virus SDBVL G TaxID=1034805 RepID=F6KIE2_9VIRU|nr:Rep2 [Mosquito VEM virus SDBVL G]AEF58773.1 Rep2 [Mosquito VEM virus SDBVL G]
MSLVLFGPSRTGKTVWARSLGTHLYFCGLYSYKEAVKASEAEYAVFDDIQGGIKFFPSFKNWLGCQAEFQVKGLYRDPELIKWGKPSIWVSNTDPRHDMTPEDVHWMEANCVFVEVLDKLF